MVLLLKVALYIPDKFLYLEIRSQWCSALFSLYLKKNGKQYKPVVTTKNNQMVAFLLALKIWFLLFEIL